MFQFSISFKCTRIRYSFRNCIIILSLFQLKISNALFYFSYYHVYDIPKQMKILQYLISLNNQILKIVYIYIKIIYLFSIYYQVKNILNDLIKEIRIKTFSWKYYINKFKHQINQIFGQMFMYVFYLIIFIF